MPDKEELRDWHFPLCGIDVASPFCKQPNKPLPDGSRYARTSALGVNVRSYEPTQLRLRGGCRPGLSRFIPASVVLGWMLQEMHTLVGSGYPVPGGAVQNNQSGRIVTLVAVSQGNVYVASAGDSSFSTTTNATGNTPPLNFSGIIYSAANQQKLWFADGINFAYYDPSQNTVFPWVASQGSLPVDSDGNAPRLIETWRGRTLLSGLLLDPQNIFMSAVDDPTNWNYSPASQSPTQAVALNLSPAGQIGDVVTGLVPYTDDLLIVGGDHTLWQISGDPMAGGQVDRISDVIGMAFGIAWCKDPYGTIYFVSNKLGIYSLVPGQLPQRISQPIESIVQAVNTGTNTIRLFWNDAFQGLHVFISPTAGPASTTHLFWEMRSNSWWEDQFGNNYHNPICGCVFDGNTPGDRVTLIGSWDGYVRAIDPTATTDDGTAIVSSVLIGPLNTLNLDDMLLKDLQAVLGATSGSVTFSILGGTTAEIALSNPPLLTGTWNAGRNILSYIRRSSHALYVMISSNVPWSMEEIRLRIATQGKVRQRGK